MRLQTHTTINKAAPPKSGLYFCGGWLANQLLGQVDGSCTGSFTEYLFPVSFRFFPV